MNYKSTIFNYRIKVSELFTKATNKDYYNLFQPVIPKIDLTGKIAQTISAATEGVTVWLICQSELSEVNKYVAFILSLVAVALVIAAIEIGGRKGLQVLTRAIVWKKLQNIWYWILFVFISGITGFLFFQSFNLSTKGVNESFKQSVKVALVFDDSDYLNRHRLLNDEINTKYDNQKETLTDAFILNYDAKEKEYLSKIQAVNTKIDLHSQNMVKGVKWAKSHFNKQTKIKDKLVTEKESKLSELTVTHTTDLKGVEMARMQALSKEELRHKEAIKKAEIALDQNHTSDKNKAAFWGNLFSNLVGFMIIIAFVCIVVVEIFRRGSGIEINYQERELPPTLFKIFLSGLNNRTFNLSYNLAKKWYVEKRIFDFYESSAPTRSIGFHSRENDQNEPRMSDETTTKVIYKQVDFIRQCERCKTDFTPNSKTHRFCSDECRKKSWEQKNGRTLKLRPKKK
ncbi:MAG: hypothetical protein AAGJ18_27400 [Bacteroidota bacterium]